MILKHIYLWKRKLRRGEPYENRKFELLVPLGSFPRPKAWLPFADLSLLNCKMNSNTCSFSSHQSNFMSMQTTPSHGTWKNSRSFIGSCIQTGAEVKVHEYDVVVRLSLVLYSRSIYDVTTHTLRRTEKWQWWVNFHELLNNHTGQAPAGWTAGKRVSKLRILE